jgi:hypothetical protein
MSVDTNADGSVDLFLGPTAPFGKESIWIKAVPDQGWFTTQHISGPLEPRFGKTWKPGEFEFVD